jgi:hypothetical protein
VVDASLFLGALLVAPTAKNAVSSSTRLPSRTLKTPDTREHAHVENAPLSTGTVFRRPTDKFALVVNANALLALTITFTFRNFPDATRSMFLTLLLEANEAGAQNFMLYYFTDRVLPTGLWTWVEALSVLAYSLRRTVSMRGAEMLGFLAPRSIGIPRAPKTTFTLESSQRRLTDC